MSRSRRLEPLRHEHSEWTRELYIELSSVHTFRVIPLTDQEYRWVKLFLIPSPKLKKGESKPFDSNDVFTMLAVTELRPDINFEPSFAAFGERASDKSSLVILFPHTITYERLSILTYK